MADKQKESLHELIKNYVKSIDIIMGETSVDIFKKILKSNNLKYDNFSRNKIENETLIYIISLLLDEYYIFIGDSAYKILDEIKSNENCRVIESIFGERNFIKISC